MSPSIPQHRSKNQRKNRAGYASRKRRRQLERDTRLQITTTPTQVRTLKRSARKEFRRERESRTGYIAPWRSDPWFRYKSCEYVSANLLGLPREVRQEILFMCFGEENFKAKRYAYLTASAKAEEIAEEIGEVVGNLSCVCPTFRGEMVWIRKCWEKAYLDTDTAPKSNTEGDISQRAAASVGPSWVSAKHQKGKEVKVMMKKTSGSKRWRPNKCWLCEERHAKSDPVCPLERRDPEMWKEVTKVLKKKKGVKRACPAFGGKKVVFGE